MSGVKLLPILILLVSGYLLCQAIPSLRRSVLRANGQQLTFRSAIAGLTLFIPIVTLIYLIDTTSQDATAFLVTTAGQEAAEASPLVDPMVLASLVTFIIALVCLAMTNVLSWYYEFYLNDSRMKARLADAARRWLRVSDLERLHRIGEWCHWQSYRFTIYSMRTLIAEDHTETLYLNSLLGTGSGLCMFVLDSKKVIIGNVSGMPEPSVPKTESQVRVLPYFTGHLCDAHLQLHITTDYTPYLDTQIQGKDHQSHSFDIVLPSHKTTYVREFDTRFFRSQFIQRRCPCGSPIYHLTGSDAGAPRPFRGSRLPPRR